jgi:hypothetical protein
MKHVLFVTVLSCGVAASLAVAGEKAAPPAAPETKAVKQEKPPLQDLVLTGKVIQQEKAGKDKTGAEVKKMVYLLETDAGAVVLPVEGKKGVGTVDVAAFVGKTVRVTGQGWCRDVKGTKKTILMKITTMEEIAPETANP